MTKGGFKFLLFGFFPVALATVCGLGLVGGISDAEWLVPVYLVGLIFAVVTLVMYGVQALMRMIRWTVTKVR